MTIQVIDTTVSIVAAFISTKQGLVMFDPKQKSLEMEIKCGLDKPMLIILGIISFISLMELILQGNSDSGNFLLFSIYLIVICSKIEIKDLNGFASELPFFVMNIMMIYMQFPIQEVKDPFMRQTSKFIIFK